MPLFFHIALHYQKTKTLKKQAMETVLIANETARTNFFNTVNDINEKGGPERSEYARVDNFMNAIVEMMKQNILTPEDIELVKAQCKFLQSECSVMGHIKIKPFGYAGDYAIIDRIYQTQVSDTFVNWDNYSMQSPAAQAVRNRKDFFKALIHEKLKTHKTLRLLNIASGPARDLKEIFDEIDPSRLTVTCVEMDERAIAHAKTVCADHLQQITFINQNVFKFRTEEKFDLVWSAGLFDYFTDKLFVKLISVFHSFLKPAGEIVIGNFSKENPGRVYMELFGEWFLNHRSPEELTDLAIGGGADPNKIRIEKECLGVNLFLRIGTSYSVSNTHQFHLN
jgi:extracellular factor (EF) 3-hydroxypalmitic acid methyl ester biosynthesis protein